MHARLVLKKLPRKKAILISFPHVIRIMRMSLFYDSVLETLKNLVKETLSNPDITHSMHDEGCMVVIYTRYIQLGQFGPVRIFKREPLKGKASFDFYMLTPGEDPLKSDKTVLLKYKKGLH